MLHRKHLDDLEGLSCKHTETLHSTQNSTSNAPVSTVKYARQHSKYARQHSKIFCFLLDSTEHSTSNAPVSTGKTPVSIVKYARQHSKRLPAATVAILVLYLFRRSTFSLEDRWRNGSFFGAIQMVKYGTPTAASITVTMNFIYIFCQFKLFVCYPR